MANGIWHDEPGVITPPDYLTDDMSVADLVEVLEHLPFKRNHAAGRLDCTISLDKGVRDYLLRAIKPR